MSSSRTRQTEQRPATLGSSKRIQQVCLYYCVSGILHTNLFASDLEEAIKEFEQSKDDPQKLKELKAELEKINKKKAEYVEEHPEMRRLVYKRRKPDEPEPELPTKRKRNYFDKKGLPRHPERSIYYDPVMNPYGMPPPGMPYAQRRMHDLCLKLRMC